MHLAMHDDVPEVYVTTKSSRVCITTSAGSYIPVRHFDPPTVRTGIRMYTYIQTHTHAHIYMYIYTYVD